MDEVVPRASLANVEAESEYILTLKAREVSGDWIRQHKDHIAGFPTLKQNDVFYSRGLAQALNIHHRPDLNGRPVPSRHAPSLNKLELA